MTPIYANAVNLQKDCPLFSKIPQEIRDEIFDLVLTPHDEKHVPYPKELLYCRPGFRHADRNLSTTLLRCCQLIYLETCDLPAKKYVQVDWICHGDNGHAFNDANRFKRSLPTAPRNLHLFTECCWFRNHSRDLWAPYTRFVATQAPNLEYLKITFGHDNSPHYADDDIVQNPKLEDISRLKYAKDDDPFEEYSWGNQLRVFESLSVMELEVETLEEKLESLDLVLTKAAGWRFPLAKGKELVFNPRKTKWEGWHGPNLGQRMKHTASFAGSTFAVGWSLTPIPGAHNDPAGARQRLIDAGADFKTVEGDPEYARADCETYSAATLVFEATRSAQTEQNEDAVCSNAEDSSHQQTTEI